MEILLLVIFVGAILAHKNRKKIRYWLAGRKEDK